MDKILDNPDNFRTAPKAFCFRYKERMNAGFVTFRLFESRLLECGGGREELEFVISSTVDKRAWLHKIVNRVVCFCVFVRFFSVALEVNSSVDHQSLSDWYNAPNSSLKRGSLGDVCELSVLEERVRV